MYPDFQIKNFSFQKQKNGPAACTVCGNMALLRASCAICGNQCCMNKCTSQVMPEDIKNKPWLADKILKHICLNCLPRVETASEQYIRTVFAEIFKADEPVENDYVDQNPINDTFDLVKETNQKSIEKADDDSKMDQFIGSILDDLAKHNNIVFDDNGKLSNETMRYITNSFRQLLYNADMSN